MAAVHKLTLDLPTHAVFIAASLSHFFFINFKQYVKIKVKISVFD